MLSISVRSLPYQKHDISNILTICSRRSRSLSRQHLQLPLGYRSTTDPQTARTHGTAKTRIPGMEHCNCLCAHHQCVYADCTLVPTDKRCQRRRCQLLVRHIFGREHWIVSKLHASELFQANPKTDWSSAAFTTTSGLACSLVGRGMSTDRPWWSLTMDRLPTNLSKYRKKT